MKILKSTMAGILAVAVIGSAYANPVVIHIAGSNGDRAIANTVIPLLLTGTVTYAGTNSTATKANAATWTGGSFNGTPVTIKVSLIGAAGAVAALAGGQTVNFLPDGATGGSNADPTVSGNAHESAVPDFIFSTNFQGTTPYSGDYLGHSYQSLEDQVTAIIPIKWLGSKNYPGNNLTTQQAQLLFSSGALPLALFTGNSSDENKTVFATGRNTDAGQRYAALAETGLGVNAVVKQYKPTITGQTGGVGGTVTSHALWPIETVSGISSGTLGNSGAATGSALAPYLTAVLGSSAYHVGNPSATAGYYISYLTPSDADTTAIPNGAVELKYNGVSYSVAAVQEGQYTFWVYEHILYPSSLDSSNSPQPLAGQFADTIVSTVSGWDQSTLTPLGGISINSVQVSRTGEGSLVGPNYF